MSTDFFDDDLVTRPDSSRSELPNEEEQEAVRKEADILLSKLQRHRDSVEEQVAKTRSELEMLRQKQDDLEKENRELENLRRKQDEYEAGKSGLIEKLRQSLSQLEKEEVRTNQLNEVYVDTRKRFIELLADVEAIDETSWPSGEVRDHLSKAQLTVDQVRVECSKGLARIDGLVESSGREHVPSLADDELSPKQRSGHGFGYWFKVGVAVGIPFALLLTLALVVADYLGQFFGI